MLLKKLISIFLREKYDNINILEIRLHKRGENPSKPPKSNVYFFFFSIVEWDHFCNITLERC